MYLTKRMQQVLRRMYGFSWSWQDAHGLWCLPGADNDDNRDFCSSQTIYRLMDMGFVGQICDEVNLRSAFLTPGGEQLVQLLGVV